MFGLDRTLIVDVQHADRPDLHAFRRHEHLAILLDEVQDPSFIVKNKKLLQAHVDGAILGQSSTQMFTYEVFLWRVPIILTTNNWDLTGLSEVELDWVRSNCVAVHIAEQVYESSRGTGVQLEPELLRAAPRAQAKAPSRRRMSKSSPEKPPDPKRVARG